jgi:hypothetical protein
MLCCKWVGKISFVWDYSMMWCDVLLVQFTYRASGEESKSFVIVVVTKSSETFIEPTSPTIWYVVLNDPVIDVSDEIVWFRGNLVNSWVRFPNWLASSFSVKVSIWPSTRVIYWNVVRLTASDRSKLNLIDWYIRDEYPFTNYICSREMH